MRASNLIPFPVSAMKTGIAPVSMPSDPTAVTILPPPSARFTPGERNVIANAIRAFEAFVTGPKETDTYLRITVNQHLMELDLVRDPLNRVPEIRLRLRVAVKELGKRILRFDDMRDILERAALDLRALIHWDFFDGEYEVTL